MTTTPDTATTAVFLASMAAAVRIMPLVSDAPAGTLSRSIGSPWVRIAEDRETTAEPEDRPAVEGSRQASATS